LALDSFHLHFHFQKWRIHSLQSEKWWMKSVAQKSTFVRAVFESEIVRFQNAIRILITFQNHHINFHRRFWSNFKSHVTFGIFQRSNLIVQKVPLSNLWERPITSWFENNTNILMASVVCWKEMNDDKEGWEKWSINQEFFPKQWSDITNHSNFIIDANYLQYFKASPRCLTFNLSLFSQSQFRDFRSNASFCFSFSRILQISWP
jgi:hypothetical protein